MTSRQSKCRVGFWCIRYIRPTECHFEVVISSVVRLKSQNGNSCLKYLFPYFFQQKQLKDLKASGSSKKQAVRNDFCTPFTMQQNYKLTDLNGFDKRCFSSVSDTVTRENKSQYSQQRQKPMTLWLLVQMLYH